MKRCFTICLGLMLCALAFGQEAPKFHGAFKEDFSEGSSEYFDFNYRPSGEDFRYFSGFPSLSEEGTSVML